MLRKNLDLTQCIFSLSSGAIPSAIAVVKLSGNQSFDIARKIFTSREEDFCKKRGLWFGTLKNSENEFLDEIVLLSFAAPHSHTGEDVIEFHCHGSVAIVSTLEKTLLNLGARPAQKGEFSYRAFLNQKISSSELENLADVFLANDFIDLRDIYNRRDISIQKTIDHLRGNLIRIQAILDTAIDFSEEYSSVVSHTNSALDLVIHDCSMVIQRFDTFHMSKYVPRWVLAGKPNAGKSSLFNAILCRSRAIVHSEPGTTRDVIEEDIELQGNSWKLVDTAGIRGNVEGPEKLGIEMGEASLSTAQFWTLVVDGSQGISQEEQTLLKKYGSIPHCIVWNKTDLPNCLPIPKDRTVLPVSAVEGLGVTEVIASSSVVNANASSLGYLPTVHQVTKLKIVLNDLQSLSENLKLGTGPEYLSEINRSAIQKLDEVIGDVSVEDVLDRVFKEFCIGK